MTEPAGHDQLSPGIEGRLDSNLFRFHRDLANQDTHKYGVTFGVRQTVSVEGALTGASPCAETVAWMPLVICPTPAA